MSNVVPVFNPPPLMSLPSLLREQGTWLVWKYIKNEDPGKKPRKVPFYANGNARGWPNGRPSDGKATEAQPRVEQGDPLDVQSTVPFDKAFAVATRGRYSGIGLAMFRSNGLVALDFDDCVTDGVIDAEVLALVEGTYSEFSPSGNGIRAFYRGELQDRKDNDSYPSVEVFCNKGYVTVTGNVTPDCEMWGWHEIADLPPHVIDFYASRFGRPSGYGVADVSDVWGDGASGDDFFGALQPKLGWMIEDARKVLSECDPNAARQQWLNALMALHHEFDGSDEALDLADEWSQKAEKYAGRKDVEGRWRSFGNKGSSPITARWLLKWHNESNAHLKYDAVGEWRKAVNESLDEFGLRERVCVQIAKDTRLGEMEREALAALLQDRFKSLGAKYPIAQCRKLVEPKRVTKKPVGQELPEWARGWVYVTDDDKFFRVDSDEWLTMQGFNARFNREMPADSEGEIARAASWYALEELLVPSVTKAMYLPWAGPMFETEGVKCVNIYRHSSVPAASGVIGAEGCKAIDVVVRHIDVLCGGREAVRDALIAWMAHNTQHPGLKIRWAPLVKGVEGDGKSLLGSLMASVMGRANVRNISPKVLGTDFTGWAEGAAIGVLEEIKLTGHNRYDILNALKPFVTNDSVEVHRKGRDPYDAVNTMNYIAFTNHGDALPLNDTDRRWFVVFTPFASRGELAAVVGGGGLRAYFDVLHTAIESHRAELRQWLLDYKIPDWFNRNGDAPETAEKASMVAMSIGAEEDAAREAIEKGAIGVTENVLTSKCLVTAMRDIDDSLLLATTSVNRLLSKLGFTQLPKKLKWNGASHRVWVRGSEPRSNGDLRALLDATLVNCSESMRDFFDSEPDLEPT